MLDIRTIPSPMGGGWALPLTDEGYAALRRFYGEEPITIPALGGEEGYMIEPRDTGDLIEHLTAECVAFGSS